jgi:hypothetical protein
VLGDGNIIFFINALQEFIEYTIKRVAFVPALVNQSTIILVKKTDLIFV